MKQLGASPGLVDDLFIVRTVFSHEIQGLFKAMHVVKKLVGTDFKFVVNYSMECQLFVKCTTSAATTKLEDALQYTFKFDDHRVKILKLVRVDLIPESDDIFFMQSI
jgi:hypothetical protein